MHSYCPTCKRPWDENSPPDQNVPGSSTALEVKPPTIGPSQSLWLEGEHFRVLTKTIVMNIISSCTHTETTFHFPNINRACSMFARFNGTKEDLRKFVHMDDFRWSYKKQGQTEIKPRSHQITMDDGSVVHILNCSNPYLSYFKKYIFVNESSDNIYVVYVSSEAVDSSEIPSKRTGMDPSVQAGEVLEENLVDYEFDYNMDTEPILDPVPEVPVSSEFAEIEPPGPSQLTPSLEVEAPTVAPSQWVEGEYFRALSKAVILNIISRCTTTQTTHDFPNMNRACSMFARFHGTKEDLRKFVRMDDFSWNYKKRGEKVIKPMPTHILMDDRSVFYILNCVNPYLYYFKKYIFVNEYSDNIYVVYVSARAVDSSDIPKRKGIASSEQAEQVQEEVEQQVPGGSREYYGYHNNMDTQPILDPVQEVPELAESIEQSPPVQNPPVSSQLTPSLEVEVPTLAPGQWVEGEYFRVLSKKVISNIISSCTTTQTTFHFPNMNRACSMFARFHGTKKDIRTFVRIDNFIWYYKKQGETEIKPRPNHNYTDDGSLVHILNCVNPYLNYFKKYIFFNESTDYIYVVYVSSRAVDSSEIPSIRTGIKPSAQAGEVQDGDKLQNANIQQEEYGNNLAEEASETLELAHINQDAPKESLVDYEYGFNMDTEPILDPIPVVWVDPELAEIQQPEQELCLPVRRSPTPSKSEMWLEGEHFRSLSKIIISKIMYSCTVTETTYYFPKMNHACSMFARFHGTKKDLRKFVHIDDFKWSIMKSGQTGIKPRASQLNMDDGSVIHILHCPNPFLSYFKKYIFLDESCDEVYVVYVSSQAVDRAEIPLKRRFRAQAGELQDWDEYGKEASESPELAHIKQEVLEEGLEDYEYEYDMDIEPILDPVRKVPDSSGIEQEVPDDYNIATEGILDQVPVGSEHAEMGYSPPAKRFRRSSPTLEPTFGPSKSMWLEEEYFRGLTKTIILRIISSCTTTETVSETTYHSPNIDHACSKFARFHGTKDDLRNFVHIDDLRWYSKRHEHPEIKPRLSQIKMDDGSVTHVLKCTNPYLRYFKKYIFLKEFRNEIYVVYVSSQAVDSGAEITSKNTSRAPSEPVGEVQEEIREGDGYNMNTEPILVGEAPGLAQVKQEVPGDNKKSLFGMLERF